MRLWARDGGGAAPAAPAPWRCVAVLEGTHSRTVRSCSWSPSGRLLATASFDRTVAIWEAAGDGGWEHAATLEGHENEVKAAMWSPSGTLIATCGRDKTVWVWEAAPGHEYEVVDVKHGHSQDVKTVAWHPSGEVLVSASYDDSIKLWMESDDEWICVQTISGERGGGGRGRPQPPKSPHSCPHTSPKPRESVYNRAGPEVGHASTVWDVAFDPSGRWLASASDDATLRIWSCQRGQDGATGEMRCTLAATAAGYHSRTVFSVGWAPDGRHLATAGADNSVCVFAVEAGEGDQVTCRLVCRHEKAHDADVNCVRWHPRDAGLLATAGDDGTIRLWEFQQGADG